MNSSILSLRSHLAWVMLLCLAAGVTACAPATEQAGPAATTEADIAAITDVHDAYFAALNAGDAAAYAAQLAEDAIVMSPDQPSTLGREANQARIQTTFDQSTLAITPTREEVVVAGDWAFVRESTTGTTTPKAGGPPGVINGKGITILQRQADGSWKIARRIRNNNIPPPGSAQ